MLKVVSLFSGVGGLDLGFINQGFNIVWANDFDKSACETYRKNIGDHIIHKDIAEIKLSDIPDCDIIIGGSPCQGFSNANRMTNFLDNPKNFLVREYIKVVKAKKPKIFVLENVPQIITAGDGQFLNEIKSALKDYHIEVKILDNSHYGVAQNRKRAIFIGSKIGTIYHPEPFQTQPKTLREALQGITDDMPNQLDYSKAKADNIKLMQYVPQGGNVMNIPEEYRPKGTHSSFWRRLEWDEPSITIVNPRKSMILHPEENRIISIREGARIQSFPDDFVFCGTLADKQQQIANAVPPLLAEAIAEQIRIHIERLETEAI